MALAPSVSAVHYEYKSVGKFQAEEMSVWMEEGEAMQQSRLLLDKSFMSPLPKQAEKEETPLSSPTEHRHGRGRYR